MPAATPGGLFSSRLPGGARKADSPPAGQGLQWPQEARVVPRAFLSPRRSAGPHEPKPRGHPPDTCGLLRLLGTSAPNGLLRTQGPGPPCWCPELGRLLWIWNPGPRPITTAASARPALTDPGTSPTAQGVQHQACWGRRPPEPLEGLPGERRGLLKPVYKDWKRVLHPQMRRTPMHGHENRDYQGNMIPPKETNKGLATDPKEKDMYELSNKELRITLIKKSSELWFFHLLPSLTVNLDSHRFCLAGSAELTWYCQQNSHLTGEKWACLPQAVFCCWTRDWEMPCLGCLLLLGSSSWPQVSL